jgi:hypothetical protein
LSSSPGFELPDDYVLKGVANQSFTAKSILQALFPDHNQGKDVYYQGSRQMTSTSRRYYEMELGAGMGPSPGFNEAFGYSEPLRRFIQREPFEPQANEIPNTMPSWMPGDDYYTDFRKGDPYIKVDQGFARLPGAGYEALHPELQGLNPEDYPDIHKMAIPADVAPYSREYNTRSLRPAQQQNPRAGAGEESRRIFSLRNPVGQGRHDQLASWSVGQLANWPVSQLLLGLLFHHAIVLSLPDVCLFSRSWRCHSRHGCVLLLWAGLI